jgi:lipoyl(octanoyl) transferase
VDYFILQNQIPYIEYIEFQERIRKKRKECLLILEHPPTITGGINSKPENLLVSEKVLESRQISYHQIKRGGDFTAHEPGQILIYPHVDLKKRDISLTTFLQVFRRILTDSIEITWGLDLIFREENPGLYLKEDPTKKLISFGLNFKSFFTSFGAGFNFENNLSTFQFINPCGNLSRNIVSFHSLGLDVSRKWEFIHEFVDEFNESFGKNK